MCYIVSFYNGFVFSICIGYNIRSNFYGTERSIIPLLDLFLVFIAYSSVGGELLSLFFTSLPAPSSSNVMTFLPIDNVHQYCVYRLFLSHRHLEVLLLLTILISFSYIFFLDFLHLFPLCITISNPNKSFLIYCFHLWHFLNNRLHWSFSCFQRHSWTER